MKSKNPYTFGGMLTDSNKFVGRNIELALIIARLNSIQPQGSAIVGDRRIGKSSLLYYLAHSEVSHKLQEDGLGVIYLSAAAGSCNSPEQFRLRIMQKLFKYLTFYNHGHNQEAQPLIKNIASLNESQSCSWRDARKVLKQMPFHPVICLDEFEALLLNNAFEDRFFNALRNWANEGLVSWVTSSTKPLQGIFEYNDLRRRGFDTAPKVAAQSGKSFTNNIQDPSPPSPFFNLLATVPLGELTSSEANDLLAQADTTKHAFTESEKRMLKRLAGNHPYHLQIVAWRLWEMKEAGQVVVGQVLHDFLFQLSSPPVSCSGWRPFNIRVLLFVIFFFLWLCCYIFRFAPS